LTPAELAETYATPHDHRRWGDHVVRVERTIAFARGHVGPVAVGADLSCGSGAVLAGLDVEVRHFGDLAPGYAHTGPIGSTIDDIPDVDVFVLCETLEHLDDPDATLKAVRGKTRTLVLSTPVEAWADANPEHYWAWSRPDVEEMLAAAGFAVVAHDVVDLRAEGPDFYAFGLWVAR
jgi:hypothetical protein